MITRVHHVGVVVRDIAGALTFWRDALGLPLLRAADVADQGVRAALLACGPSEVELLEPTRPDTGVARFLERRGGGLHHVCLESDEVAREIARLAADKVELIDRAPRPGLAGRIAFLHPRACGGVLVELATPPDHAPRPETPLAVRTVGLAVDDAPAAARLWSALFGVAPADPAGLVVGGVTLRFDSARAGEPVGLAGLTLEAPAIAAVAARLARHGVPVGLAPGGLRLDPARVHGVPLAIRQSRHEEVHA